MSNKDDKSKKLLDDILESFENIFRDNSLDDFKIFKELIKFNKIENEFLSYYNENESKDFYYKNDLLKILIKIK